MSAPNVYEYCTLCGFGIESRIVRLNTNEIASEYRGELGECYYCHAGAVRNLENLLAESRVTLGVASRIGDQAAIDFYSHQIAKCKALGARTWRDRLKDDSQKELFT